MTQGIRYLLQYNALTVSGGGIVYANRDKNNSGHRDRVGYQAFPRSTYHDDQNDDAYRRDNI